MCTEDEAAHDPAPTGPSRTRSFRSPSPRGRPAAAGRGFSPEVRRRHQLNKVFPYQFCEFMLAIVIAVATVIVRVYSLEPADVGDPELPSSGWRFRIAPH